MITISACMIVKNEEKVLERCLESIKSIADEIIIVDTGSSDKTKEIAGRYTKHVFDFAWQEDFSAARNFSISKAVKDYIYIADADEILDEYNQRKFLELKRTLPEEVEIVQMYYTNQLEFNTTYNYDKELRPKLYKRVRHFYFMEPVHEMVRLDPVIYDSDIEICHKPHGFHGERDLKMFRKVVGEQGKLSKRLQTMYAKELFIAGSEHDFLGAKQYFAEAVEDITLTEDEIKQCQCVLARCARLEKNKEDFFKNCLKNVATGNPSSEVCYELGEYYFEQQDYREAFLWYYNAIHQTEPELDIRYGEQFPTEKLAICERYSLSEGKQAATK